MMGIKTKVLFGLFLMAALAYAEEINNADVRIDSHEQNIIPHSTAVQPVAQQSSEVSLMSVFTDIMATTSGILTCSMVVVSLLAFIFAPMLGFNLCTFFSNCEQYKGMSDSGAYDASGLYQQQYQQGQYPPAQYQQNRRSFDNVGPILTLLTEAYQKYTTAKRAEVEKKALMAKNTQIPMAGKMARSVPISRMAPIPIAKTA